MTLARMVARNKLSSSVLASRGLREMQAEDTSQVVSLWQQYMKRFNLYPCYSLEEFKHNLLSGSGHGRPINGRRQGQVVWSYVVEVGVICTRKWCAIDDKSWQNPETHLITDFFTFYSLPSTVMRNPNHGLLEAAYLYYYASDAAFGNISNEDRLQRRLQELIGEALIIAQKVRSPHIY